MTDIIAKCIPGNVIDNGGILVAAPKGTSQLGIDSGNYQINTYSSASPATGTVYNKYDTRFTGIAPCVDSCGTSVEAIGDGAGVVFFV